MSFLRGGFCTQVLIVILALFLFLAITSVITDDENGAPQHEIKNQHHNVSLAMQNSSNNNASRTGGNENCKGVLITSIGGVGSSGFLYELNRVSKKNNIIINQNGDRDGFKHMPANWWKEHDAHSIVGNWKWNNYCFNKVLVIIGDPIHVIESTHRRFEESHINKLKKAAGLGTYPKPLLLQKIYYDILSSGKDQTGVVNYIQSWNAASQDIDHWPEIKFVTAHLLYDCAVNVARWIGVGKSDMNKFSSFHFDTTKRNTHNTSEIWEGVSDEMKEAVAQVFVNELAFIDRIEKNNCSSFMVYE